MQKSIKKIAITGGTHGNELTGVYLINKFKTDPAIVKREGFETIIMHTNKKAIEKCTRYIDNDLNRAFGEKDLEDGAKSSYEDISAKLINQVLGPKGTDNPNVDFIVDLHSTTSNMGLSVVIDIGSQLTWQVAAYLKDIEPKVNIFRWMGDTGDAPFVNSIAKNGFAIEVGAVPQGVLRADLLFETEKLVHHILDFFEKLNRGEFKKSYKSIEIYDFTELVDFPRDEDGNIIAMVHPQLQDNDYTRIEKGDPLFISLDGEIITYDKDEAIYPLFVNEAAYYEKGFAMCLARKRKIELEA
jgi:aspartoacylase